VSCLAVDAYKGVVAVEHEIGVGKKRKKGGGWGLTRKGENVFSEEPVLAMDNQQQQRIRGG